MRFWHHPKLILQLYFWITKSLKLVSRISWECAECQAKIYQDMMSSVDSLYPPFLLLLSYYLYISHIHSRSQTVKTHDCFLNLARKLATNLEILISVFDKNLLFWQPKSLLIQLLRLINDHTWCHFMPMMPQFQERGFSFLRIMKDWAGS